MKTHIALETIKRFPAAIFHAHTKLEAPCHTKPSCPLYVCRRHSSDVFCILGFPSHAGGRHAKLWCIIVLVGACESEIQCITHSLTLVKDHDISCRTELSSWWRTGGTSECPKRTRLAECEHAHALFISAASVRCSPSSDGLQSMDSLEALSRNTQERTFCKWCSAPLCSTSTVFMRLSQAKHQA